MIPLPEDPDCWVIIGNKPDYVKNEKGEQIKTEPYLRVLMDKLTRHKKIFLKVINNPEKLGKLQELFEILKFYAVVEIDNRKIITEPHKAIPDKKFQYIIVAWEIHPKLDIYRQIEIYRKME